MNRWTGGGAVLALMALAAADVAAQRGTMRRGGGMGPEGGPQVERILSLRADLELSEAQAEQLEAIRRETVERRTSHRAEVEELASQLRAGGIEEEALRERMQALREGAAAEREAERERVSAILDETQRQRLEELSTRSGPRRGAMRRGGYGPGMGSGMRPGARMGRRDFGPGDGWGPRAGMRRRGFGPGGDPGAWAPMRRGPRFPRGDAPDNG